MEVYWPAPHNGEASTVAHLKRQFRLVRAVGTRARYGWRGVSETPAHRILLADAAVDDDLHGTPGPIGTGQEHALFDFHVLAHRCKRPQFAIIQQQDCSTPVGQPARFHRRMNVKADREFIVLARGKFATVGGCEAVLPFQCAAIGREADAAIVNDSEFGGVAVVRSVQRGLVGVTIDPHLTRARQYRPAAKEPPEQARVHKTARRALIDRHGRMGRCCT